MDLNSLKNSVSNLTLYDLKAGVRQLQNAVMNYTEMEAKVREATNNEPWGASSTIMQEIANGTFNFQLLNEIMPMIYHRFTEKTAEQWRQIYKALQLLEFLIKNGSERVIDDARAHMSLLKMLRQFHFIDQNGKDQGINVRNRSKELVELLSDVDKIRAERKKAKSNRTKYSGYEGGGSGGGGMSSGSRYGGFGSESAGYGAYDGRVYGDGGGFGGESSGYDDTQGRRDKFEEYDEFQEGAASSGGRRKNDSPSSPSSSRRESKKTVPPPKAKQPEIDLFDFGDEPSTAAPSTVNPPAASSSGLATIQSGNDEFDDFDDFQSAPPAGPSGPSSGSNFSMPPPLSTSTATPSTNIAAPKPQPGAQSQSINNLFASISPVPVATPSSSLASPTMSMSSSSMTPAAVPKPANYQPAQPNYFTSVPLPQQSNPQLQSARPSVATTPGGLGKPIAPAAGTAKPSGDAFAGLLGGMGAKKESSAQGNMSMADLARQKASAGIWGTGSAGGSAVTGATGAKPSQQGQQQKLGGGLDDLLG